jgi:hypothetical protein
MAETRAFASVQVMIEAFNEVIIQTRDEYALPA